MVITFPLYNSFEGQLELDRGREKGEGRVEGSLVPIRANLKKIPMNLCRMRGTVSVSRHSRYPDIVVPTALDETLERGVD